MYKRAETFLVRKPRSNVRKKTARLYMPLEHFHGMQGPHKTFIVKCKLALSYGALFELFNPTFFVCHWSNSSLIQNPSWNSVPKSLLHT